MNHNPALTHAALVSRRLAGDLTPPERADIIGQAARTYVDNPKGLLRIFAGLILAAYEQMDAAIEAAGTKPLTTRKLARTMRRNRKEGRG